MLQLASKNLPLTVQETLDKLQKQIAEEVTFAEQVEKAKAFWKNKTANTDFEIIKETLGEMCVSIRICNYCEHNESSDIEHIFPKGFFPEYTFVWENYLLACKLCNSGYKLDQCFILDTEGTIHKVSRGTRPSFPTVAIINARLENPTDFFILNTETFKFELREELSPTQKNKAEITLKILHLNNRDTLIHTRRQIALYIYTRFKILVDVSRAESVEAIRNLLTPHDDYPETMTLEALKTAVKEGFKKDILTQAHPSVWYAIKLIDSKVTQKWKALFEQLPEALAW